MKIGNILAAIGIVLGFLGLLCLPLWNLHERPYLVDSGYPKGSGWIFMVQTGFLNKPGLILLVAGLLLVLIAKLLPDRYWASKKILTNKKRLNRKK